MWWGGGGGDDPKEATPTPDSDVMEILSEEDMGSPGAARAPGDDEDEADLQQLKRQFREQEDLLGQLRGVLQSNEEKLVAKEREVQASVNKRIKKIILKCSPNFLVKHLTSLSST